MAALTDNLISYWKLDEASGDALDAAGANALTETSGTIDAAVGIISGARDFEAGDTEYFEHADNAGLSNGGAGFSFFCWVKPESVTGFPTIANKSWASSGSDREWLLFLSSAAPVFRACDSLGNSHDATWGSTLSNGTWYFIAGGHDGSNAFWISVNAGTPVTVATTAIIADGTGTFQLGAWSGGTLYWDGLIDEAAFFKRDIRADLASFYNAGAGFAYPFLASTSAGANRIGLGLSIGF